jgi:hypothetical protein
MSKLLQEAIEEVRVVSAALREESQALRAHASALRDHATEVLERSAPCDGPFRSTLQETQAAKRHQEAIGPVLQMFQDAVQRQDGGIKSQDGPNSASAL